MITIVPSQRLLLAISAVAAILVFLIIHETANATVPEPDRDVTLASHHDSPRGMWSDGTTLWVVENNSNSAGQSLLMSYNLADGSFNEGDDIELASSNSKPQGIWSDGTVVWVADWDDTKLYAYALSDFSRMADRDINLSRYNDGPRGIWGFDETILVIDRYDTKVYAYSTTDGSRLRDQEFDLHTDNDHPWGIWGQGTRVWISDINDQQLYVYQRSPNNSTHGDRVPSLEIRLPSDVDDVRGIWSDGETMWVADDEANTKIHAMHFHGFRHTADEIDVSDVATPAGLWTDGETMWVADKGRTDHGMLFAYSLSDQTRDSSKDVQLGSFNKDPITIWSDGETVWAIDDTLGNDYLYAYHIDPEPNEVGQLILHQIVQLHTDNADPVGIWSNGNNIWVSDSEDDKLYAYDLSDKSRKSGRDISLDSQNADPSNIWSDGETIWVLDTNDKHAYAYDLSSGNRRKSLEFWTVPDNDDPAGGLTGHGLRFWVVDGDDKKLYAYGGRNTPPSFGEASASFEFHRSLAAGDYIGTVPEVEDPDGDSVFYLLTSGGFGVFTLDYQTGELFIKDDAPAFTGGESYTLTVSITDGRNRLDALDGDMDDAIDININVLKNDDPGFTTADGTVFSVAEDAELGDIVADLEIIDLDDDSLFYEFWVNPASPFNLVQGDVQVSNPSDLNYESTNSYEVNIRVRDNKDKTGQSDLRWDDDLTFTIQVSNVEEEGILTLNSANPQVDVEIVATLMDPDGVELVDGNQVNWVVERSTDTDTWTEVSDTDSTSTNHAYTPVSDDAGTTLRFTATYKDGYDTVNAKTIEVETTNTVLGAPPTNQPPTFGNTAPKSLTLPENTAIGTNVGSPIPVSDPENDTLTLAVEPSTFSVFDITSGGQLFIKDNHDLDYENLGARASLSLLLRDSKDPWGVADTVWDTKHLVLITVTNVDEAGTVTLSSDSPEVGVELDARVLDPDRAIHNLTWQWQSADSNPSDTWTDISGATSASYTPTTAVAGKYLRAKALYGDAMGSGKEAVGTATGAVNAPDNRTPQFNEGATATRSVNEDAVAGTRLGAAISALDPDNDTLTYSLAAGSDSDKFIVDTGTGQLEVAAGAELDYETDSSLEVVVQVTDSKAADHSQDTTIDDTITVTIELLNVDDPGVVTLSMMEPEVGESITATLTDNDGGVTGASWHWEKSNDGATNWETINGSTSPSYMPVMEDEDMYLRAMVNYTDGEGSGKSADGMTGDTVKSTTVDTSLASLSLNGIPFTFDSGTLDYNLTVPHSRERTRVIPTTTATSGVSVAITPADSKPGRNGHQVELAVGETRITVTVSEDQGAGSTTYTLLVTREPAPQEDPPQENPAQEDPPSEDNVADKCRKDEADGLIAYCSVGRFAVVRVELDGRFTIDWSEWDSDHPNVTGYDIFLNEMLYKIYYDQNGRVSDPDLADVYESCEFVDGQWNCVGRVTSNYNEDWDGNPTQMRQLASNEDRTEWSSSLNNPGRHMFDRDFVRWSGDSTDPGNEPADVSYQVKVVEMDFHYFYVYEGSQVIATETLAVDGANGFE